MISATSLPERLRDPRLLRLWDVLPQARVVGGAVRDACAARPVADVDLATPERPEQTIAALESAGLRVIPTGLAHGTVTALVDGAAFEITTLRRDVETDGRHAVVAFTDDWQADAARRDFTFNAMSLDRAGTVFDYFAGRADLLAGRVRFVGDAHTRIAEDFLRVLRFFRFFARYGTVEPDPGTQQALRDGAIGLARLSAERVWSELQRILAAPDPGPAIALMERLGILGRVVPDPLDPARLNALLASAAPADPLLRLAALSRADPGAFVGRYRIATAEYERLRWLRGDVPAGNADDATLRRWLIDVPRPHLLGRLWLHGGDPALRARIEALPDPAFPLLGRDLLAAGWQPGRDLGEELARLRAVWRDGGGVATRAELLAQLGRPASG